MLSVEIHSHVYHSFMFYKNHMLSIIQLRRIARDYILGIVEEQR